MASPCSMHLIPRLRVNHSSGYVRRAHVSPVTCGTVIWEGSESVPRQLTTTSVKLHKPSGSIDGLALFQLSQNCPHLKELKVSAASFDSPVKGQWCLRSLQTLHVEFDDLRDDEHAVEKFLQHADKLYLKVLRLTYTGPGMASLQASSLAKLHVEHLVLEGFDIQKSAKLAKKRGRLIDCVLDVSQQDLNIFYKSAPQLQLERCRLPEHALSWRMSAAVVVALALSAAMLGLAVAHPTEVMLVTFSVSLASLIVSSCYSPR